MREPNSPAERLVLTLRVPASGDSQQSFFIQNQSSSNCTILSETCEKLWEVSPSSYVRAPSTVLDWKKIRKESFLICFSHFFIYCFSSFLTKMFTSNKMQLKLILFFTFGGKKFQKQTVAELAETFAECSFKFISRVKAYDKI